MSYATATTMSNDTNAVIHSIDDGSLASVYIPRVYGNISHEFIQDTFKELDLGIVSHIQTVKRPGNAYMAFVYFKTWNTENPAAVNLAKKVNDPSAQARVVYDDPWYWILLPNTSSVSKTNTTTKDDDLHDIIPTGICAQEWELMEKNKRKKQAEEKLKDTMNESEEFDILKLMVEDLQIRLRDSEKKQALLQREVFNLRTILLTGESTDTSSSPMKPVLVRQSAVSNEDLCNIDSPPPNPPKLVRQNATVVDNDENGEGEYTFNTFMFNTIANHMTNGDKTLPPRPAQVKAEWWPTAEDLEDYHEDRMPRRIQDSQIETVKVDGMGLVYPSNDSGFWCDP